MRVMDVTSSWWARVRGTRAFLVPAFLAALTLSLVASVSTATPAWAANGVELSDDGVSYGSNLPAPVFSSIPMLVPGVSASAPFWVRNPSTDSATMTVVVRNAQANSAVLAQSLSIAANAGGAVAAPVTFASVGACSVVVTGVTLHSGQAVKVNLTLALDPSAGNSSQGGSANLELGVTLEQLVNGVVPGGCSTTTVPVPVIGQSSGTTQQSGPPVTSKIDEGLATLGWREGPRQPEPRFTVSDQTSSSSPLLYIGIALMLFLIVASLIRWLILLWRGRESEEEEEVSGEHSNGDVRKQEVSRDGKA